MIQINIKKQNIITNSAIFDTQELADQWLNNEVTINSFGKSERWLSDSPENSINIEDSIDSREVTNELTGIVTTEYKFAAEFTVEQLDVTAQVDELNRMSEGKARQEIGANVIAKVYSINESKNISDEEFAALLADSNLERIERMLWTGSLKTAKSMIQALNNAYFTDDEKNQILDMLSAY